jgi:hypothetical protein
VGNAWTIGDAAQKSAAGRLARHGGAECARESTSAENSAATQTGRAFRSGQMFFFCALGGYSDHYDEPQFGHPSVPQLRPLGDQVPESLTVKAEFRSLGWMFKLRNCCNNQ